MAKLRIPGRLRAIANSYNLDLSALDIEPFLGLMGDAMASEGRPNELVQPTPEVKCPGSGGNTPEPE